MYNKFRYSDFTKDQRRSLVFLPKHKIINVKSTFTETLDWGLDLISAIDIWRSTRGSGIKIAVLDTGIDKSHPDLKEGIMDVLDFTGTDRSGYDDCKHGTHVAGIIGARANGFGIIGVAPESELYIGKIYTSSCYCFNEWLAAAINHAVDKWDVDIISISGGTIDNDPVLKKAIANANSKNKFIICSAGNRSFLNTVEYPGKYDETIAVGAIDKNLRISNYSSKGVELDTVAPGDEIYSTYPGGIYASLSGTSMAAPFVSGLVALMLAKHRDFPSSNTPITNNTELKEHLEKTAIDLGPIGRDCNYGHGLYNYQTLLEQNPEFILKSLNRDDLTETGYAKVSAYLKRNL